MTTASQILPPVSLGDWQRMVWGIYREKDLRDYTESDMVLCLIGTYRGIARGIRRESREEVLSALPKAFIWLLSLCSRLDLDVERIVWAKYPGLCPYCGAVQYCSCIAQPGKPEILYRNDGGIHPSSLDEWQRMFERIYGRVNRLVVLSTVGFHFGEELSEVSTAFRFRDREDGWQELGAELADVFAWLMALATRYNVMLSTITYDAYPGVCDTCRNTQCTCPKV